MTYKKLVDDIKKLGITNGDTILLRANIGQIGRLDIANKMLYIDALLESVGENGTIVSLAFTDGFLFGVQKKTNIFDGSNKSYAGALPNLMLRHPNSYRSTHPTNSYVAIGKNAKYITNGHDENSGAYEPIRKIIELNGKMVLIGCVKSSPGFTTTHLAEIDLKLHKNIIWPTLNRAYYKKDGEIKIFKRKDLGGCSSTFYKMYAYYVYEGILQIGYVGKAYSIIADAQMVYNIDRQVLTNNPKITICDSPTCIMCRARRWDNLIDMPKYICKYLIPKILKKIYIKIKYKMM